MLKPNQIIKVKWHSQNKEHYINKGYVFTKYKDEFLVKAEDLSRSATAIVKVDCDYCGEEYEMVWYHYKEIQDKNEKCACYNCRNKKKYENNLRDRQLKLYEKALKACDKKGYILASKMGDIKNNTSYIVYICPIHGEQKMRIANLINGRGCPECNYNLKSEKYRLSPDEVEKRIVDLGGKLLNKQDYINNTEKNLIVRCAYCGTLFSTSLALFTQHGGQMCSNCKNTESIGERRIKNYFESNNILYEQEKWFHDCRDIKPLPFDFYLPYYNMIVEFDGEQHFKNNHFTHSKLSYTQAHDTIKNEYCKDNNIKLVRIPYWDINNIETILNNIFLISHKDIV
jgi:very-short-patch-repair endonuclease